MAATFERSDLLHGFPLVAADRPVAAAPRGPKGLWDAMARAAGDRRAALAEATATALAAELVEPELADGDSAPVLHLAEDAHLAYLARVAAPTAALPAAAPAPDATVVDLAAFRARRGR
jgi:hypothetical protein